MGSRCLCVLLVVVEWHYVECGGAICHRKVQYVIVRLLLQQ